MGNETPDPSTGGLPDSYDQYTKPTDATGKSQGYSFWKGLPVAPLVQPVTNLAMGDQFVNEADPSWEDVIAMVVIPGEPGKITTAAGMWDVLFSRIEQAKTLLDDGISDLKSWEGQAGETYRNHLSTVSKSLGDLIDKHRQLGESMRKAATDLQAAIDKIPIPDDMVHEVQAAKSNFDASGKVTGLGPDAIYRTLMPIYSNKWMDQLRETFSWDWAQKNLRDWISGEDDKAKRAYKALAGNHVDTMDNMPDGAKVSYRNPNEQPVPLPQNPPTGKVPSGLPKTGMPDTTNPALDNPSGFDRPPGSGPGLPDTDPPGGVTGPGTDPGLDPPGLGDDPGTSLAGAGGGLSGAGGGLGAGGLGAGGGLPGAGGGLGAGGPGSGAGLGAAGGLPGAGLGGVGALPGAGAGRGVGGRGGRLGGMMGGMGGGHGTGAGAGEDEHSTWLSEDEDPWGTDNDAAPPVLGA